MDPEQIYQEVLQEEQQKGVGRSGSGGASQGCPPARRRGLPSSQGSEMVARELSLTSRAEMGPRPHRPKSRQPKPPPSPRPQPEPEPAPAAAAAAGRRRAPAAEPAPAEPAAPAPRPQQPRPRASRGTRRSRREAPSGRSGVTHGTPRATGSGPRTPSRPRPSSTASEPCSERRKVIDELVSTGVPAVAAQRDGQARLSVPCCSSTS